MAMAAITTRLMLCNNAAMIGRKQHTGVTMCNVDTAKDYVKRAVSSAVNPSFNPIKQTKRTIKNSLDVMGQQKAAEEDRRALMMQQRTIDNTNNAIIDAAPGSYVPSRDKFMSDSGALKSRRKRNTLLTEDTTDSSTSLLG